jgi:hypothetical protein
MSDGENSKFMQQKADYLDSTVIIWRESQALKQKGIYEFDLERTSLVIKDSENHKVQGCILTPLAARGTKAGRWTKPIRAYYLPFQPNRAFHHRLDDDVDYCFTPTLNGCTFCIGSGAQPMISHYNYVDDPQAENPQVDQDKIDRQIARRYGEDDPVAVKRAEYKAGSALDYKVTVVGFRINGSWHFYYQRRAEDLEYTRGKGSTLVTIATNMKHQLT